MNLKKIFKKFILIDIFLLILLVIGALTLPGLSYEENNQSSEMFDLISLIWLLSYFVCWYFLYKFKPIGKQFYLFLFIIGIIISLLGGSLTYTPLYYILDGLSWVNTGVILTFLYFSPIKKEFDK